MKPSVAETILQTLTDFFNRYGYWVVFFGVMLENGGLPLPGETVLLFAGFLAYQGEIHLTWAIAIAICGATIGDSLGYSLGRFGGAAFFERYVRRFKMLSRQFDHSKVLFQKHGHWAVFTGRFIAGLRIFAGPLAGLFRMPYPRFLVFNFSGAVVWATAIGCIGFFFGSSWERLLHFIKDFHRITLGVAIVAGIAGVLMYLRKKKRTGVLNDPS